MILKDYILFDLDGTLTDPKLGITKAIQYALKAHGIIETDPDTLCCYIGPPLRESFQEFHGFDEEGAEAAVASYREYFSKIGIYENTVFDGIDTMLKGLKQAGKTLIIATSKPEEFAGIILEHFKLHQYFTDICGATMDSSRTSKEDVIRYAVERNHITDLSRALMVGDRMHDVEGARSVGLASIGVLFGYGSKEELEKAGVDKIAATVEELYGMLLEFD